MFSSHFPFIKILNAGKSPASGEINKEDLPEWCGYGRKSRLVCSTGECEDIVKWCDGHADCKDSSDETNCPKGIKHFLCKLAPFSFNILQYIISYILINI